VDCDVHCAVPSPSALSAYLDRHWADFIGWTGFKTPGGVAFNYPPWVPMFAAGGGGLGQVQETVLAGADRALLQCYFGVEGIGNPYLAAALARAVNCWLAEEWLDRDGRLYATAAITPQHAPQAVEEIQRLGAHPRFVQVLLPARSAEPYGNQRYWPILEAAAEHDLALGLTYGGVPPIRWTPSFLEDYVLVTAAVQTQITSLIMCGVFDRWPKLRVTVCESGWTWLPGLLWRMDQEWKAYRAEVPWLTAPPSEYLRRHFRFTIAPTDSPEDPAQLANTLNQIGAGEAGGHELLLYASDFPHSYPSDLEGLLSILDPEQRQGVFSNNALAWYWGNGRG
jgi:predicted TIM-barrel fold metal-dependent hydrolase